MASKIATPRYCVQHSRFTKQDGWRLYDLSFSLNGNIAVTGYNENTYRTYIDVHTNVRHSDSRDKPKLIYSKEFEKYEDGKWIYPYTSVSFIDDDVLVSCPGYKLEVFQVNKDEVLRSRSVNGSARCLFVRERREIFLGFYQSNKITVYDVIDLNEIKSIILQGIQDGYWPGDMTALDDRIFVCVGDGKEVSNHKSLIFEEKNGRILSEFTRPTDTVKWYVQSVGVNMNTLGLAAVVWWDSYYYKEDTHRQIVFYSLLSENNCSFLNVEVESGVYRIRISDRGDRMITGNIWTGEVKVYGMAEVFTYNHFKEKLTSILQTDECTKLANFFKIPKDQTDAILSSEKPSVNLLRALEEKDILQSYNVERLIEAFEELTMNPFYRHVAEILMKTRSPEFYTKLIKEMEEKMRMAQTRSEDETMQLKEKATEVEDLQKELKELRKQQEAHLQITQERECKLKAVRDEDQLQLSSLKEELEAVKNAKAETEKVLIQTEELLQKIIQEKNEIKTELKQLQVAHSLRSVSLEEGKENQAESGKKVSADTTYDASSTTHDSSSTTSPVREKYLPESLLEDEFAKLLVKVAQKLSNSNCVMMAAYFNLPQSKLGFLQKESDTSGIELFHILKERNIINMYDVSQLQEVLSVLHLVEVNETLAIPYQNQIDPLLHQMNKVTREEH
ncbi:hypothetical protein HOLleu_21749 [Holothuria leucospilota]|uniref:DED domain-containing protein n=1 Tax=Holothuria leucospilota TaxID=206669 RepID=A0A9Q1BWV0_HOLLE|nr:hypothetical protein HOLleu_21749 [Holothuria leucospilota]